MVRDEPSFTIARQHFSDQVLLIPDAAHHLWRRLAVGPTPAEGERQLFRKDKEAPAPGTRLGIPADDWIDMIPRWTQHLFGLVCRMHMLEGMLDCDLNAQSIWYRQSDYIVDHAVRAFSRFASIRSNRLHACLLALLLNKPATLIDNSYGKLRHYHDAWLKGMAGVTMQC
jgi:pyruvyl transferase EpsO